MCDQLNPSLHRTLTLMSTKLPYSVEFTLFPSNKRLGWDIRHLRAELQLAAEQPSVKALAAG